MVLCALCHRDMPEGDCWAVVGFAPVFHCRNEPECCDAAHLRWGVPPRRELTRLDVPDAFACWFYHNRTATIFRKDAANNWTQLSTPAEMEPFRKYIRKGKRT